MIKIVLIVLSLLLIPSSVFAAELGSIQVKVSGSSDVSVKSESQGETTTCVNGDCKTTGGDSKTTVCINGKCEESTGDVNITENNGDTKIQVKSNTNSTSVTKVESSTSVTGESTSSGVSKHEAREEAKKMIK
jgi:hypothetical protein